MTAAAMAVARGRCTALAEQGVGEDERSDPGGGEEEGEAHRSLESAARRLGKEIDARHHDTVVGLLRLELAREEEGSSSGRGVAARRGCSESPWAPFIEVARVVGGWH